MRDFDKKLYPNTYNYVKDNIVEGVRCNRCGTTVLISEVEGYTYQCMHCDEDEHIGQVILAIIQCNYYSKDITEDCFGVDFNLLSNYTAEVTSELEELNKFATKEITQRTKKYEHNKAQEKVFGLVESYFEEGRRNGYHDFKMWCEDNTNNDTEKMIIEKIATEVNTIGTWLFE